MKELTSEKYAETLKTWRSLREISFNILPVTTAHFKAAAALLDATDLNLRAGDALHLAIAADHKLRLLTLDTRMAQAAEAIGVGDSGIAACACFTRNSATGTLEEIEGNKLEIAFEQARRKRVMDSFVKVE